MKKEFRKAISVLLAVIMVLSVFSVLPVASAAESTEETVGASRGTTGDCIWNLDDNGTLTISGNGAMGGQDYLWGNNINKIVIENGVTKIGWGAFRDFIELTEVSIPDSIESIDGSVFQNCCSLTNIIIPDSVTEINYDTFSGCEKLTDVTIPDNVEYIGSYAFNNCKSLKKIIIPKSVNGFGNFVFSGCTSLDTIIISPQNTKYDSRNGSNAIIETDTNKLCVGCKSTVIPDSVTEIGDYAFSNCTAIKSILIPESVVAIGFGAFSGCNNLETVTIPDKVTSIGLCAFQDCSRLKDLIIGCGVNNIDDNVFTNCSSLQTITVSPNNPTYDSRNNCNAIIETSSNTLLRGCETTIIPSDINCIGFNAFDGCVGLTNLHIPENVNIIQDFAFDNCTSLKTITVDVNNSTFDSRNNCNAIIETQNNNLFLGCRTTIVPDSVQSIGCDAFKCYDNLFVIIPQNVTEIWFHAFCGCKNLKLIIPQSVTKIDNNAFDGCSNICILGYSGTYAETYANERFFATFIDLANNDTQTYTDDTTGIGLTVENNLTLNVVSKSVDEANKFLLNKNEQVESVFDISLSKDGLAVQPMGIAIVTIPTDKENAKVYRAEDDRTLTDMNAMYKNGYLEFITDHFSEYVVAIPKSISIGDTNLDGNINIRDVTSIQRHVSEYQLLTDEQLTLADVNGDGVVDINDATHLQRYFAEFEGIVLGKQV